MSLTQQMYDELGDELGKEIETLRADLARVTAERDEARAELCRSQDAAGVWERAAGIARGELGQLRAVADAAEAVMGIRATCDQPGHCGAPDDCDVCGRETVANLALLATLDAALTAAGRGRR